MKCACNCGKEISDKAAKAGWKYLIGHKPKVNGNRPAGGGKLQRSVATGVYAAILNDLQAKRDRIDRAIEAIREISTQ